MTFVDSTTTPAFKEQNDPRTRCEKVLFIATAALPPLSRKTLRPGGKHGTHGAWIRRRLAETASEDGGKAWLDCGHWGPEGTMPGANGSGILYVACPTGSVLLDAGAWMRQRLAETASSDGGETWLDCGQWDPL